VKAIEQIEGMLHQGHGWGGIEESCLTLKITENDLNFAEVATKEEEDMDKKNDEYNILLHNLF
jgi:hypothetical protein